MTLSLSLSNQSKKNTVRRSKTVFGERDKFEAEIRELLDLYNLEDALEEMDLSPEECLSILLNGGYACLPPFLKREVDEDGIS